MYGKWPFVFAPSFAKASAYAKTLRRTGRRAGRVTDFPLKLAARTCPGLEGGGPHPGPLQRRGSNTTPLSFGEGLGVRPTSDNLAALYFVHRHCPTKGHEAQH